MEKRKITQYSLLVILIIVCVVIYKKIPVRNKNLLVNFLKNIKGNENSGFLFIIFMSILGIFFVPISYLKAASAAIFGIKKGFLYSFIGSNISCIVSFFIGRFLGKDFLYKIYKKINKKKKDMDKVSKKIDKKGFEYVFILRNIPVLPFAAINYLSGSTSIKFSDYFLASFIGMVPGTFLTVYFFGNLIFIKSNPKKIIFPLIFCIVYYFTVFYIKYKSYKKENKLNK